MASMRVGIAGLGTVGSAVARRLVADRTLLAVRAGRAIDLVAVASRSRGLAEQRLGPAARTLDWFDDPVALAASDEIDLFIELIGGSEGVAKACVEAAIATGKPVVTANKALLAYHGMALAAAAEARGTGLSFEAAVAGGIPIIKILREAWSGNRIARIYGILNGTCNYILTRMEQDGLSFDACLAEAQRLGYAEADPSFDIDGFDTAHKLAILASLAFGTALDLAAVHVEGIRSITPADLKAADDLGYRVKLLGVAERSGDRLETRVHPTMVGKATPLAGIGGVTNAITIHADAVPAFTVSGPGAGGEATASAVLADIVDAARGFRLPPFGQAVASLRDAQRTPMQRHEGGYYVRLSVQDRIGAIANIATRMAARGISFESIVQRQEMIGLEAQGFVPVMLITHATSETLIREALDAVEADGYIAGQPQLIRIERS